MHKIFENLEYISFLYLLLYERVCKSATLFCHNCFPIVKLEVKLDTFNNYLFNRFSFIRLCI